MNGILPSPTPSGYVFSGNVRKYYVAAEEVEWNYAPTGWDNWLGVPLSASPRAQMSGTTAHESLQPPWQGTLGPTLRSEVGDLVEIMFVNRLSQNYASMHSMGLSYTKYDEGSAYPNNTAPGQEVNLPDAEAVPPGGCVIYKWFVDEVSGPPAGQPAVALSYHSYVALQQDTNAGLIGPQIVYAPGQMAATMAKYREFPLLYMIYNEGASFLSGQNAAALNNEKSPSENSSYLSDSGVMSGHGPYKPSQGGNLGSVNSGNLNLGNESVWTPQFMNIAGANRFDGAPSIHSMNGYIFANNPMFEMCLGDNVIWYTMSYGSMSHVFHMHGNSFRYNGIGAPSISINDGEHKTLFMNATGAGLWQVLCHVNMHQSMGMVSNYQVHFAGQCPLSTLGS
ncbi:Cupredoxin [Hortaea werneckii]|nr:Cupredoxin [Hortaea werneckii]